METVCQFSYWSLGNEILKFAYFDWAKVKNLTQ